MKSTLDSLEIKTKQSKDRRMDGYSFKSRVCRNHVRTNTKANQKEWELINDLSIRFLIDCLTGSTWRVTTISKV